MSNDTWPAKPTMVDAEGHFNLTQLSTYPFVYISVYLSVYLSIYLSIDLSIYRSIYPSIHPSVSLTISLPLSLSIYLSLSLCAFKFTKCCTCHEICIPRSTRYCAYHEIWPTKYCTCSNLNSCRNWVPARPSHSVTLIWALSQCMLHWTAPFVAFSCV